jgi:hypothetical protein
MKFTPPINDRETDELIFIANDEEGNWHKEAINLAKAELFKRNISVEVQKEKIKYYTEKYNEYLELERNRDYSVTEKIMMVLFWYQYFLWDWGLRKNGYIVKANSRLKMIGLGILLYTVFIIYISVDAQNKEKNKPVYEETEEFIEWKNRRIEMDSIENQFNQAKESLR